MIFDLHTCWHVYEMKGIRYSAEDYLRHLDACGIDMAMVCHPFSLMSDYVFGNDRILELMDAFPDRVVGFATIHPLFGDEAVAELERCAERGMKGVKFHCDLAALPYDHPAYRPVVARATELGMPLFLHTGADSVRQAMTLVRDFPDSVFVFAHCGGEAWREAADEARPHPNLNFCLSGLVFDVGFLAGLVERLGEERVLFGSDFVYLDPNVLIGMVRRSALSDSAKAKVLGLNAERMLGL
jgi:hypothetical protein